MYSFLEHLRLDEEQEPEIIVELTDEDRAIIERREGSLASQILERYHAGELTLGPDADAVMDQMDSEEAASLLELASQAAATHIRTTSESPQSMQDALSTEIVNAHQDILM